MKPMSIEQIKKDPVLAAILEARRAYAEVWVKTKKRPWMFQGLKLKRVK